MALRFIAAFSMGALLGAIVPTVALGSLAAAFTSLSLPLSIRAATWMVLIALIAVRTLRGLPLPERGRLIPREVLARPYGVQRFGAMMATGIHTFLPPPPAHVLAVSVVLAPYSSISLFAIYLGWVVGRSWGFVLGLLGRSPSYAMNVADRAFDSMKVTASLIVVAWWVEVAWA